MLPSNPSGDSSGTRQSAGRWQPVAGWQVLEDSAANPDFLEIGLFGEPYVDPSGFPPNVTHGYSPAAWQRELTRRRAAAELPRLVLRCENGTTAAHVRRPTRMAVPARPRSPTDPRVAASSAAREVEGLVVLAFNEKDRIDIDLSAGYRPDEPLAVPDPYDNIGRMRRAEKLYYFEIDRYRPIVFPYGGQSWSAYPDAVFELEGLDDLLRGRRDPCGWRAA